MNCDRVTETDVVDDEQERLSAFGQCGECNRPDRVMNLVKGELCVSCSALLSWEDWK